MAQKWCEKGKRAFTHWNELKQFVTGILTALKMVSFPVLFALKKDQQSNTELMRGMFDKYVHSPTLTCINCHPTQSSQVDRRLAVCRRFNFPFSIILSVVCLNLTLRIEEQVWVPSNLLYIYVLYFPVVEGSFTGLERANIYRSDILFRHMRKFWQVLIVNSAKSQLVW